MQSKKLLVLIPFISIVFTFLPAIIYAEETTTTNSAKPVLTDRIPANRDIKPLVEQQKDFKNMLHMKREEAKEKFQAQREAFAERVEAITDEKKKELMEKIDSQLATINQNRTDHFSEKIQKLESILSRISEKAATLKASGKNTAALDAAITRAQTAIDTAKTAVANQAGKEYIASIGSEATLRTTVGAPVRLLQSDLRTVHGLVVAAKQAVQNTIPELAKLGGVGNIRVGSDSAKITVTPTPIQSGPTETPSATPSGVAN